MSRQTLFEGKYLRVLRDGNWEFVQRTRAAGVAVIVACTDDDELILIEQERVPVGARVLELPAGLSGDITGEEDESLETAARRELLEETGYEAGDMRLLIDGPTTAGLSDELITVFLARDVEKTGEGGGDGSEDITTHLVGLDDVHDFIVAKRADGVMVDPKVFAGLYWLNVLRGD